MPMQRSNLAIYLYSSTTVGAVFSQEIGSWIRRLQFSTVSPGGYGTLSADLPIALADVLVAQIGLFSSVVVVDGVQPVWIGELTDPEQINDEGQDEYIRLTALGIGNCLRDDPLSTGYAAQTAKAIVSNQLTVNNRANALPISQDTALLFPDNPVTTFTTSYSNATFEEVVNDVTVLQAGATGTVYSWGVWAHATAKDAMGFPLGQLVVHQRDTNTTHYQAGVSSREVTRFRILPTADRAYNVIKIAYYDPANGGYGVKTATDSRLGGSGTQGTAPFRRRTFFRDLSGSTLVTAAVAQTIANTYLAQFQNGQNKATIDVRAIRDGNGNRIPLHWVQADHNIFLAELADRGQQLSSTVPTAGTNQFYIVQTHYTEDSDAGILLSLDGDNYVDRANYLIARLQNDAEKKARTGGNTTGAIQALGAPIKGKYAIYWDTSAGANQIGNHCAFPAVCQQTPTSISFTVSGANNATAPAASNISSWGFDVTVTCNHTAGANNGFSQGFYTTVGNTLLAVRPRKQTFDWHCQGCHERHVAAGLDHASAYAKATHTGLALHDGPLFTRLTIPEHQPGATALAVCCPDCGDVESFNTGLTADDALDDGTNSHRAQQATRIRALMAALGLATA
ncbi:MAG TPA: hypothetical protein VFN11_03245 [Ktedonobacterales bacterium]|nr:hypothetical protein [Ktedonobacterales bacterium]